MRRRTLWFLLAGLALSFVLAGVVSNLASAEPDGLDNATRQGCTVQDEEVTDGECIARDAKDHELDKGPLSDYTLKGIDNPYLATGLSGVIGVAITFAVGGGLFWLVRRRSRP